jgi:glucoamylase
VCITKTYTTDVERATVLIDVRIESPDDPNSVVYVYYDPSLNNSGMHDTAWGDKSSLLASDGDIASALISSTGFEDVTSTFAGVDDKAPTLSHYDRAENGNVVHDCKAGT